MIWRQMMVNVESPFENLTYDDVGITPSDYQVDSS